MEIHQKQFHYTNGPSFLGNQSGKKWGQALVWKHIEQKKKSGFVSILTFIVNECRLFSVALKLSLGWNCCKNVLSGEL